MKWPALIILVAVACFADDARACTPLRPSIYFQTSTERLPGGQEDQIQTLVRISQQEDLATLRLLGYTSVDMDMAEGRELAARRIEVLIDLLVREGGNPAKLRMEAVGPAGARDTRDPVLSNYIQAVPEFLRDGLLVDGCGSVLSQEPPRLR